MAERQLIVAVEGTSALGPYWRTILSDYIDKIVRSYGGNDMTGQKLSGTSVELALVVFNTHGPYSAFIVQRSGWTKDVDVFSQWLSGLSFSGGGFSEAAIAEGLAEALMMFSPAAAHGQQNPEVQRHCVLVAASNPHPLPTPVYIPPTQMLEHNESAEVHIDTHLADAETVAKSFGQHIVSLSVISPKQLTKLRAIYNAAKRNPRAPDPTLDNVKSSQFLVLLSENFMEGRAAFSRPLSLPANQNTVKLDGPHTGAMAAHPPTSVASANGLMNRQALPVGNMPTATVKVEPTTVSMVSAPSFSSVPSIPNVASQGIPSLPASSPSPMSQEMNANIEGMQELKPTVAPMTQPLRPAGPAPANVNILNNLSLHRQMINSASIAGGSSIVPPMAMHMSNMISSGMASSGISGTSSVAGTGPLMATTQVVQNAALGSFSSTTSSLSGNSNIGISPALNNLQSSINTGQTVAAMGQGGMSSGGQAGQGGISMNQNVGNGLASGGISSVPGTMIPTPGMSQQAGTHSLGVTNNSSGSMQLAQNGSGVQQGQSKYIKIWEGALSGQRQGQPVFICKLEGYRNATSSETLAADWPPTMQIVRLISQDHMNNKQYLGKADFLVFRTLNQHGFLAQLQEKKLCAVIQLPSQTLLLSVTEKASRLIGLLFPGDMVVFKPQVSSQQQQQQQPQQLQPQQQQQQPALQPLQQQQLQQHQQQQLQQLQQPQQQQQPQQMVGAGMGQVFVQGVGRSQMMPQGKMAPGPNNLSGGGFLP